MHHRHAARAAALYACLVASPAIAAVHGQADAVWTPTDSTVLVNVLANDGDLGKIRSSSIAQPLHGRVRWVSGRAEYTPEAGYAGSDSFRYSVVGSGGRKEHDAIPACKAQGGHCACSHNSSFN